MDTAINFDKYQSVLNKTYFKKLGKGRERSRSYD